MSSWHLTNKNYKKSSTVGFALLSIASLTCGTTAHREGAPRSSKIRPAPTVVSPSTSSTSLPPSPTSTSVAREYSPDYLDFTFNIEDVPELIPTALVRVHFKPEDHEWALRVMFCESSNRPDAYNESSGASGLFQHLRVYWEERSEKANKAGYKNGRDIFNASDNVVVAAWLYYEGGGARHWECK
jgi:hypothetical protein